MSANPMSSSSRGTKLPLTPSSEAVSLEQNTHPNTLQACKEDLRRAELARQVALLEQQVQTEVAEVAEVVVPVSPPKPSFLELAQTALEKGRTPAVEARQASAARVAEFQAVLDRTLLTPPARGSVVELPAVVSPEKIAELRAILDRPYVPVLEPVVTPRPPTDPQIFWDMLETPKPLVEKVMRADWKLFFPPPVKKFVPSEIKRISRKALNPTPLEQQEPIWESIPLELYTPFCVSSSVLPLWCPDSKLPTPPLLDLPLEMYADSTLDPSDPKFVAKLSQLLEEYRVKAALAPIALQDSVVKGWVSHIQKESKSAAFYWHRACQKLKAIDLMLGHVRLLVRIIFTIALSSGRKVFSLALWQLAEMIGVSADYIGELLVTHHDLLRRLFFFREKFVTLDGKEFSQGYIWRVDLERKLDSDLMKMPLVAGNMKMFEVETRDLEADILSGYTAKGWKAKKQAGLPPGEKLGNRRGKVRNITSKETLQSWEMLEGCCHRAAGVRPDKKEFQLKSSSSRYEVADAVNAPVGHTRGEQLGWVRRLGTCLAAFLGGAGDLKLWFKVGWTALKQGATNILADALNEVIIRNQDADQRNSSAIILAALLDRGLILRE